MPVGAVAKPSKATAIYYKSGGWIPLQEPDSRFEPGAIFVSKPNQYPQWVSSLRTCGVPADILKPSNNIGGAFSYVGSANYDVSVVGKIKGVSIGPDFKKASTATFDQSDSGGSAMDIVAFAVWMSKNPNAFQAVCKDYLSQPDTYVARESYRVGNGRYTLKDNTGATLKLSGLNTKVVELSANADVRITGDSTLEYKAPVYTALHAAVQAGDFLKTLGNPSTAPTIPTADQRLLKNIPD